MRGTENPSARMLQSSRANRLHPTSVQYAGIPWMLRGGGIGFPPPRLRSLPQNKALPLVRKIVNGFKKNRLRQIEMNHLQLIVKIQIGIKIWTFRGNIGISSLVSAPPNSSPAAGFYTRIDVSLEKWSIK